MVKLDDVDKRELNNFNQATVCIDHTANIRDTEQYLAEQNSQLKQVSFPCNQALHHVTNQYP
jgi:hypothetical protein